MKAIFIFCLWLMRLSCLAQNHPAIDSLQHLLSNAKEDSNKVLTLLHLAGEYENNQTDSADKYYREALQTSRNIHSPFYTAKSITWFTFVLNNEGKLDESLRLNVEANAIAKQLNNLNLLTSTAGNIGNSYAAKSDYANALGYYFQSLANAEKLDNKVFLNTLCNNIASAYRNIHQPSKALGFAKRGLEIAINNADTTGMGDSYQAVASCYDDLKQFDSSIRFYKKAEAISEQAHDDYLKRTTLGSIGFAYKNEKKYAEAIPYIMQSIRLAKMDKDVLHEAQGSEYLAGCYLQTNKIAEADSIVKAALPLCEQSRFRDVLAALYLDASNIALQKGNAVLSHDYFEKWKTLNDSLINETVLKNTAELDAKYQSAQKQKQILSLQKQQAAERLKIERRNIFIGSLLLLLFFAIVISFLLYRSVQRKKRLAEQENIIGQQTITQLRQEKQLSAADALLRGQEEERSRLAKDLHDGLGGRLSGIKQNLYAMKGNQIITEENAFAINKIITQLDGSIDELRSISRNMMPEALIRFGLKDALQDYCSSLNENSHLKITYQTFGLEERISQQAEIIVFRIVQELVNNVMKHARANNVIVQLVKDETRMHITVEDDGKGFDAKELTNVQGVGWLSIKSRADYFNGTIDVVSSAGKGTAVNIEFQNAQLA